MPPSGLLFSQAAGGCGATNIFFSGKASLRNSCPHPFSCVNTAAWGVVWQFGWLIWSYKKNIWEGVFLYTWLMSVVWSEGTLHSRKDTKLQQEQAARGWKILKPTLPPVKTSSADTLMASQPSMASQAPKSYMPVDHYLCDSPGMSHGWRLTTRFPQAAHLRHCQHSLVPFPFHQWAG